MKSIRILAISSITLMIASLTLAGCDRSPAPTTMTTPLPAQSSPGLKPDSTIGVMPAPPSKEGPGTTSSEKSDMTKQQESTAMPMPGQANDHSTLDPKATNKSSNK
jgi:hypothetical protein